MKSRVALTVRLGPVRVDGDVCAGVGRRHMDKEVSPVLDIQGPEGHWGDSGVGRSGAQKRHGCTRDLGAQESIYPPGECAVRASRAGLEGH